jgi:hypothetical protein
MQKDSRLSIFKKLRFVTIRKSLSLTTLTIGNVSVIMKADEHAMCAVNSRLVYGGLRAVPFCLVRVLGT